MLALSLPAAMPWTKHGFAHPKRERGSRTPYRYYGTPKCKPLWGRVVLYHKTLAEKTLANIRCFLYCGALLPSCHAICP